MKVSVELPEFKNEPPLDFSKSETHEELRSMLDSLRREYELGDTFCIPFPILISNKDMWAHDFARENPSNIDEVLGRVSAAKELHVDYAVKKIKNSKQAKEWAELALSERAEYLKRIAGILRERRMFFTALMMLEVGKTAPEADGDICEAIDFIEYYALQAAFLEEVQGLSTLSLPGEKNEGEYIPVGDPPICASIQPWNFPVAISAGPAAAALVTGHAVIYKPAEQSSIIGYYLAKAFYDSGIPEDVFHYLPGYGEEVGSYLVEHPDVKVIAFTGSKEVRTLIQEKVFRFNNEKVNYLPYESRYEKRTAALESGGKNVLIVDSDADLDEVILGVSESAFSFQGQKCSACSRLVVVDSTGDMYNVLLERLKDRVESLHIGSPEDSKNNIGPLVDKQAYGKIQVYMAVARSEGRVVAQASIPHELHETGWFVPPTVVDEISPDSRVAQEEIFGPLLAVFRVDNFDEALELANYTEFGLTAGVYSRNPVNIERVKKELKAGNIYINRKISGSMVARQPFGGFKMSGDSTKTGGWDYLLNFVDRRNISENTMRRGTPVE